MLEALLLKGSTGPRTYFPESGPGNKTLIAGSEPLGYFGRVSSTDMFEASYLDNWAFGSYSAATKYLADGVQWCKFIYNGKFIYICARQLRMFTNWYSLYNYGLVYGVDGPGGGHGSAADRNQLRTLTKTDADRTWLFKARTLTLFRDNDPYMGGNVTTGSEWNLLVYRLVAGNGGGGLTGSNLWDTFTTATFSANGSDPYTVGQHVSNSNSVIGRGMPSYIDATINAGYNLGASDQASWRPVLELIP